MKAACMVMDNYRKIVYCSFNQRWILYGIHLYLLYVLCNANNVTVLTIYISF